MKFHKPMKFHKSMGQESQSREWSLWSLVVPAHFEGRVVTSQRPK